MQNGFTRLFRDGETIDTQVMAEVDKTKLISLMVGRELSQVYPKKEVTKGEIVLELKNLGYRKAGVKNITLAVRAGEIVGIAGLVGAGRTEFARAVFGLDTADEGEVFLHGKSIHNTHPQDAIRHKIAYLPEDRRKHGVILDKF